MCEHETMFSATFNAKEKPTHGMNQIFDLVFSKEIFSRNCVDIRMFPTN